MRFVDNCIKYRCLYIFRQFVKKVFNRFLKVLGNRHSCQEPIRSYLASFFHLISFLYHIKANFPHHQFFLSRRSLDEEGAPSFSQTSTGISLSEIILQMPSAILPFPANGCDPVCQIRPVLMVNMPNAALWLTHQYHAKVSRFLH